MLSLHDPPAPRAASWRALLALSLVLAACGRDGANQGALHQAASADSKAEPAAAGTSILERATLQSDPPSAARVEVERAEELEVVVRFGDHAPDQVELYVLDPEVYSESAFRAIRSEVRTSAAWRFVEELATRVDVEPRSLPGGAAFTIVRPSVRATVVVRMGEAVGRERVTEARDGALELELDEFRLVSRRASVVDQAGHPVPGVSVGVASEKALARFTGIAESGQPLNTATVATDADGLAELLPRTADSRAFALLPGGQVVAAALDSPFQIQLPPLGALVVSFEDKTAVGQVALARENRVITIKSDAIVAPQGTVRFDGLSLGQTFVVRGESPDGRVGASLVRGPLAADESVEVVLTLAEPPCLTFRLVDESGAPLPGVEVAVRGLRRNFATSRSDEEGVVEVSIDPLAVKVNDLRAFTVVEWGTRSARRKGEAGIELEAVAGRMDVGAVILRGARVVAQGRVVDAYGLAVSGADVELYYDYDPEGDGAIGLLGGSSYQPETIAGTRVVTGDDGSFEVRSAEPVRVRGDRMYLRARAKGMGRVKDIAVPDGAPEIVVELAAEGVVLVDAASIPTAVAEQLDLVLRDAGGERVGSQAPGPAVRFDGLASGEHSLTLELFTTELVRIDGLVVPAGGTSVDPRLSPLALAEPIRSRSFQLVSPSGETIRSASVQYWLKGSRPKVRVDVRSDRVAVIDSASILRAAVLVEGHAAIEVTRRTDGEQLELVPEMTVDLVFVGLNESAQRANVNVRRVGSDLPGSDLDGFDRLPADGVLRLRLPGPGHYNAMLRASYETVGSFDFEVPHGGTRIEIDAR